MNDELISEVPVLHSVAELGRNYDAWLVDLWGVMHNGETAIETAVLACERYRDEGGIVLLLSNAPRPWPSVRTQIEDYGVPSDIDDGIVTSGDVTRAMIAANSGRLFYHLGPDRDRPLFEGLQVNLVKPEQADLVVLTGFYDDTNETAEDYRKLLTSLKEKNLPVICANPDIKVERGDEVIYAAGAIAALYEELGGKVAYAGKPYRPIYDLAMAKIDELAGRPIPAHRILAIGDGINTDIKGAVDVGIDALFIPSGVHVEGHNKNAQLSGAQIGDIFKGKGFGPINAMMQLMW
ncbi:MAG: TIGR01459 family HAD-type hydrolase [Hyphomicrobiaceae bacterium]|nr:TIGR01459 family HAD-type hydrolase [Hyphomicrobiaceae bacterium]